MIVAGTNGHIGNVPTAEYVSFAREIIVVIHQAIESGEGIWPTSRTEGILDATRSVYKSSAWLQFG
jgi:hypothetical protein